MNAGDSHFAAYIEASRAAETTVTEEDIVMTLGGVLSGEIPMSAIEGWSIEPLDIGEIEVTTRSGQFFRLYIETPNDR